MNHFRDFWGGGHHSGLVKITLDKSILRFTRPNGIEVCSTGKLVESSYLRSYLKHFKVLTGNGVRLKNTLVFRFKMITSLAKWYVSR